MALYQRENGIYYAKIGIPGRKPARFSTGTRDRDKAQEVHDRQQFELWEVRRLGVKPRRTWDEAALKWLQEKKHKKSYGDDVRRIRWFTPHLRGLYLEEITRQLIDDLLTKRLKGVSNRTRDLYLAVVRGIMRRAMREWQWIDHVPAYRSYETNKKGRVRWLRREQVHKLLQELPKHTREVVLFSLATGLRMSNALGLKWADVDLDQRMAYIHPDETKNGEPIAVPLNDLAVLVLERRRGQHRTHVFSYRGRPIKRTNTHAWQKALKRAGLDNFRWHDMRHTWASWMRQSGVPTWALQELGGWKSESMVRRYAHINADHLAPYTNSIGTVLGTPQQLRDFLEVAK